MSKKLIYIFFLLFFSLIKPHLSYAEEDTPCTVVNNAITDITDCATQPTIQRVVFLKAALCKASSINFPTTNTPIDTSSCSTIWENSNGVTVDIKLNTEVVISSGSDIKIPDPGTYPIVYLEMKPYFGTSVSKQFAQAMGDTSGNPAGGGRIFCRSLELRIYNWRNTTPIATLCSTTEGDPGITTEYFNSLGDDGGIPDPTYNDNTLNLRAALITANRMLIPTPTLNLEGTEDKLVAWFIKDTIVTPNTTGFSVGFANTSGAIINLENSYVKSIVPGPFNITFTPN